MIEDLKIDKSRRTSNRWSFESQSSVITEDNYYQNDSNFRRPVLSESVSTERNEVTAEFAATGNPFDLAISGFGYFQVELPNGEKAYTRDGMWKISDDGRLTTSEGYPMTPEIYIPEDALTVNIDCEGKVRADLIDCSMPMEIGQIRIADIENPSSLTPFGRNIHRPSSMTGHVNMELPGKGRCGRVEQGYLELNDVNVIDETLNMMAALKIYTGMKSGMTHTIMSQDDIPELVIG